MLHLLLGSDDYSKKQHIDSQVKQRGGDLVVFNKEDQLPPISKLFETDLFSKPSVFLFNGVLPEIGGRLEEIIQSLNLIVISIISVDKRKKENKDLLANSGIILKEFNLPHGTELNKWLEKRVGELGGQVSKLALEELAIRLGRDNAKEVKVAGKVISTEEVYSLWQAENEIRKLMSFVTDKNIEIEDVQELVPENYEVDVFEIINAIGEGKKQEALSFIQDFLQKETASDEKAGVIQLNALLSDQMRSIAITQDFLKRNTQDSEIIKQTGWKSGRLYIMKKIASKLNTQKVSVTLPKLEALDEELKTSQTPSKVLLDMIVAQIF
jgi:DNA polymerase III delta subunit